MNRCLPKNLINIRFASKKKKTEDLLLTFLFVSTKNGIGKPRLWNLVVVGDIVDSVGHNVREYPTKLNSISRFA